MTSRYRIALGENQMDELDENLLILDIGYSPVEINRRDHTVANFNGFTAEEITLSKRTVTVTFELHIYGVAERNKACQTVNAWARAGGVLTINDREDQYLENVICDQYADIESARNWTDPLTLVFSTTTNPYWLSVEEKTLTMTGKGTSGNLALDGNDGNALVSVEVTASATLTTLQITAGNTSIKLTGLSVVSGQKVIVDYVEGRYMRIRANGSSAMAKLNPSSSDNLSIPCGSTSRVALTANANVTAVFTARGCWL